MCTSTPFLRTTAPAPSPCRITTSRDPPAHRHVIRGLRLKWPGQVGPRIAFPSPVGRCRCAPVEQVPDATGTRCPDARPAGLTKGAVHDMTAAVRGILEMASRVLAFIRAHITEDPGDTNALAHFESLVQRGEVLTSQQRDGQIAARTPSCSAS